MYTTDFTFTGVISYCMGVKLILRITYIPVSIIHVFHSQNGELKLKKQCKSPVPVVATFFTSLLRDKKLQYTLV